MAITAEVNYDVATGSRIRVCKVDGVDLAAINTVTSAEQDLTFPAACDIKAGDIVLAVTPPAACTAGLIISHARVKSDNTVAITLGNPTAGSVNEASSDNWFFTFLRP